VTIISFHQDFLLEGANNPHSGIDEMQQ
jgi:hypothetical protein